MGKGGLQIAAKQLRTLSDFGSGTNLTVAQLKTRVVQFFLGRRQARDNKDVKIPINTKSTQNFIRKHLLHHSYGTFHHNFFVFFCIYDPSLLSVDVLRHFRGDFFFIRQGFSTFGERGRR